MHLLYGLGCDGSEADYQIRSPARRATLVRLPQLRHEVLVDELAQLLIGADDFQA